MNRRQVARAARGRRRGRPAAALPSPALRRALAGVLALSVALLLAPPAAGAQQPAYDPGQALADALVRYRQLAAIPELRPPELAGVVRPGAVLADAAALRRYLVALGDLPDQPPHPGGAAADTVYDGDLVAGVTAFQRRHALATDGVIGPATAAAMRVPLGRRVRQLELASERWRELRDSATGRFIVVNIPAFRLYAFGPDSAGWVPALRMNVIVGQAGGRHATPVFSGVLGEVVFQPYWDVPLSIARGELLPKIRRDAGYMRREGLEIVSGGDHGATIYAPTAANLSRVASGSLRLRQRPGPLNALGAAKFLFPNRYNVYLHGTPAQQLFARDRRDFSHGCIRIEDPAALAGWVLEGQGGWNPDAIRAAMTTGPLSRRVRVERPLAVHVLYATAAVGEDGLVRFYADIYRLDAGR